MQYKGDDLDLRVPARSPREAYAADYETPLGTNPGNNGRWPRSQPDGASVPETLWVDETLLSCCNYAYDVALANGAGEVGLEHLVNALTRVEAAARILESRGVREGQLRRESAAVIASEIPVALGVERASPRRGPDLEDVLRRAVEQAGRRGGPATVDDVIWVLLHYGRELPAVLLMRRLTPDWQRADWGRQREIVATPVEPRQPAPPPPPPQPVVVAAPPAIPQVIVQNDAVLSRISLLEDSLRTLHADLSTERKALGDLLRDTQRDIVAQRGDAASLRSDLAKRLEALERGLQARSDPSRLTVQLADRIQGLEKAVHSGLGEGARNWAALGQRLQGLEASIEAGVGSGAASIEARQLQDRLTAIEQMLEGRLSQSARVWTGFTDRLQSVERLIESGAGDGGRQWSAISDRLGTLETLVRTKPQPAPAPEVAELTERIGGLERAVRIGFGDSVQGASRLSERIEALERTTAARPPGEDEAVLILDDRMQSIERLLHDSMAVAPQAPTVDTAAIFNPLAERLALIERVSSERADSLAAIVREATLQIATLDQRVGSTLASAQEMEALRDREIKEMQEALVRLGENQLTLASAIADWRHECHNDFSSVTAQLERIAIPHTDAYQAGQGLEMPSVVRRPAGSSLQDDFGPVPAATPALEPIPEAEPKGSGFWWWLFGTSNVSKANRDAEIRWQQMHRGLKDARDRRRERA